MTPGLPEPLLRGPITLEHDAVARRDREHVRGHGFEFFIRDLDEFEPVFLEESPERHGEQTRIDHREVIIQDADERHQVQARREALEVRQWDLLLVDPDRFYCLADPSPFVIVAAASFSRIAGIRTY